MANSTVQLNISKTAQGNGWTPATASDGGTYYYKYVGGNLSGSNGNKGNVDFEVGDGSKEIEVSFVGQDGGSYTFVVYRNKTTPTDLKGVVNSNNTITITDSCLNEGDFDWGATVAVNDSTPTVTFECDPRVTNRNPNA